MGLSTVLNQVSDNDIIKFMLEMENLIGTIIDEIDEDVVTAADLDMRDKLLVENTIIETTKFVD